MIDQLPPEHPESERAFLGAMMLGGEDERIREEHFYLESHRVLFTVMKYLRAEGKPADPVVIAHELECRGRLKDAGGPEYIAICMEHCTQLVHAEFYASQIIERYQKGRIVELMQDGLRHANNGKTPAEILDWLKSQEIEDVESSSAVEEFTLAELRQAYSKLHLPVVDGLFRERETVNVVSVSKVGKSWLAYDLALSVVTGVPWLGRFDTSPGPILLIDNELHRATLASRIPVVGDAHGIQRSEYEDKLTVWPLRGDLRSIYELRRDFERIAGRFKVIIIDAKYRIQEGEENSNRDQTQFYNEVDRIAELTGAAVVLIHHSSKGSQSEKRVTDVGAGAGAQSRTCDCHIIVREHEEPTCAVMEAAVRSFPPVERVGLRWNFPLWTADGEIDLTALRRRRSRRDENQNQKDRETDNALLEALRAPQTVNALVKRVGMSPSRIERGIGRLVRQGLVEKTSVEIAGRTRDGYRKSIHAK